jgi:hypothetical protein
MIIQISGFTRKNVTVFGEVLQEQNYINSTTKVSPGVYHIDHDLSKECRNLCADLLDNEFKIELIATPTGQTS